MTAVLPDVDPFSPEFLADPYPAHEVLRKAGLVVHLERCGIHQRPATPRSAPPCTTRRRSARPRA